jgi:hypothetical protein
MNEVSDGSTLKQHPSMWEQQIPIMSELQTFLSYFQHGKEGIES